MSLLRRPLLPRALVRYGLALVLSLGATHSAFAQDEGEPRPPMPIRPGGPGLPVPGEEGGPPPGPPSPSAGGASISDNADGTKSVAVKKVPCVQSSAKVTMDFADAPLVDVVKYMAEITCRNFILQDDLKGSITIISHQQVSVAEAYEGFLSAMEVAGYTTVTVGKMTKVVPTSAAASHPVKVYEGDDIPGTDNFVTQIITLDNVAVQDISTIVKELAGGQAKVIAYNPTNTLIITDSAYNIRRVYRIVMELDVAAPKSKLQVIPLRYATAADVERILEEMFGIAASGSSSSPTTKPAETAAARRKKGGDSVAPTSGATSTAVGSDSAYVSKIISDERTNSLIVMANEEALTQMTDLIARLDVDIDPNSRAQIHVIYLENSKATDISGVLTDLVNGNSSSGGSSSSSSSRSGGSSTRSGGTNRSSTGGGVQRSSGSSGGGFPRPPGGAGADGSSASAALGSASRALEGVRITADENTNSLVIVASPEDYRILKGVIDKLDIMRRQVFVEAVVLEVGSQDSDEFDIGVHSGIPGDDGTFGFGNATLGGSGSLGTYTALGSILAGTADASAASGASDLLSGLAMGVFGKAVDVEIGGETVSIPGFGIVVNALASNSAVDILSNPSLLIVDNEEAKINVGRNVPFPVSSGRDTNNNPIVSYQREDVGITLTVTPQINEANYVTLELALEVAEVEEDSSGLDVTTAGFITSKRETENVVVVKDNQTIVIGGLIGNTSTEVETKIPVLGDIPLIGVLFRGHKMDSRKTNLLIFLTPHVINEPADLEEVYRVKWAQRAEFMRRFYGKSREKQEQQIQELLTNSMNMIDEPSVYREKVPPIEKSSTTDVDLMGNSTSTTPTTTTPTPAGGN